MPTTHPTPLNVLIASYLEPEYIAQIRAVDDRLNVIYEPELLPVPRYLCDHIGAPRELTPAQEQAWREHLRSADIQFDFDYVRRTELPELAPNLRWLQATSAGIGQLVKTLGYDQSMANTLFTTASGVHAIPLAEWCVMSILNHYRNLPLLLADQRAHRSLDYVKRLGWWSSVRGCRTHRSIRSIGCSRPASWKRCCRSPMSW
ncbi:MAG: hypothetical protein IPK16_28965 [Anaerolineales bacterium]|nr:hypothetical protein [Anaerolineales bacterium]